MYVSTTKKGVQTHHLHIACALRDHLPTNLPLIITLWTSALNKAKFTENIARDGTVSTPTADEREPGCQVKGIIKSSWDTQEAIASVSIKNVWHRNADLSQIIATPCVLVPERDAEQAWTIVCGQTKIESEVPNGIQRLRHDMGLIFLVAGEGGKDNLYKLSRLRK